MPALLVPVEPTSHESLYCRDRFDIYVVNTIKVTETINYEEDKNISPEKKSNPNIANRDVMVMHVALFSWSLKC